MTGADGHPDVDEISALAEGLLSPSGATSVRRHLRDCAECSDTLAALEEVRGLLGAAPTPSPMPLDVAERIDAALAAETLLSSTQQPRAEAAESLLADEEADSGPDDEAADSATETVSEAEVHPGSLATSGEPRPSAGSLHRPPGRRVAGAHVSRETSPSGTAGAPDQGRRRPASGPGRKPPRSRWSRGRRRSVVLGAVFTAVVIGMGSAVLQTVSGSPSDRPGRATSKHPPVPDQVFSEDQLEGQVDTLLKDHPEPTTAHTVAGSSTTPQPTLEVGPPDSPNAAGGSEDKTTKTATPLQDPGSGPTIPECVKDSIGRSDPPIAAERGIYEGKDAYLVVLPHATDTAMVSAYVVDAACTQNASVLSGTILLTHSYPRG